MYLNKFLDKYLIREGLIKIPDAFLNLNVLQQSTRQGFLAFFFFLSFLAGKSKFYQQKIFYLVLLYSNLYSYSTVL